MDTSKVLNNAMMETLKNTMAVQTFAPSSQDGHVLTLIPSLETQLLAPQYAVMERTWEQRYVTMETFLIT